MKYGISWEEAKRRYVAPVRERGLKFVSSAILQMSNVVAPVRERGLKSALPRWRSFGRMVAPVRERGLKYIIVLSL